MGERILRHEIELNSLSEFPFSRLKAKNMFIQKKKRGEKACQISFESFQAFDSERRQNFPFIHKILRSDILLCKYYDFLIQVPFSIFRSESLKIFRNKIGILSQIFHSRYSYIFDAVRFTQYF